MIRSGLAAAFVFLTAVVVYVPIAQPPVEYEPDASFRLTTHDAFARRLQLGRDIVSTYGPWGILQRGYDRRTDAVVLGVSALLAAAFAWGVFRVARDAGAAAWTTAAIGLAACGLIAVAGLDGRFTAIILLLILSSLEPRSDARELPLVAALGVVALVKFSSLGFSVLVVAGLALARRRIAPVLVLLGSLLVFWIAAGQPVTGIPRFLSTASEVARGYSVASASLDSGVPPALIGVIGFAILTAAIERDLVRAALLGGAALLLVRVGYVRADLVHTRVANSLLLFLIGGYLLVRGARRALRIGGATAAVVALAVGLPVLADATLAQWAWLGNRGQRLAQFERELRARCEANVVPAVGGTIDAYPWGSGALILAGRRYAPRPVFQSCMAWTSKLAEINAEHLRGAGAPEWLLAGVGAIDGHLPLLDDGPSWLEMMRRYDLVERRGERLLLHRAAAPKPLALQPLLNAQPRYGEEVILPHAGLLWCTIDIRPPFAARLRDALGRARGATLELTTADGAQTRWPVSPDVLRGGFFLSPLVTGVDDLARLFAGDARRRVTRLRLFYDGERYDLRITAVRRPGRA